MCGSEQIRTTYSYTWDFLSCVCGSELAGVAAIFFFRFLSCVCGSEPLNIRIGENWQEEAVFGDLIGRPLVVLSGDGKTVVVAANNSTTVFENIGGSWQEPATLNKFGQISFSNFKRDGISVSFDGKTVAVGRSTEGNSQQGLQGYQGIQPQLENSGAVWVYTRGDGTWLNEVYVKASNTSTHDRFGHSVSLSANGDTLAVGAYVESGSSTGFNGDQTELDGGGEAGGSGAVYLY